MNGKKNLMIIGVGIVIVLAFVAVFMTGGGKKPSIAPGMAENAVPAFKADGEHVLIQIKDTQGLKDIASMVRKLAEAAASGVYDDLAEQGGLDELPSLGDAALEIFDTVDKFVDATEELALLVDEGEPLFVFASNGEKYAALRDALSADAGGLVKWETPLAEGRDAFVFGSGEGSELYVLSLADGAKTVIAAAGSSEMIERSAKAWGDAKERASIKRKLDGPNFIEYRLTTPSLTGGTREVNAEVAWSGNGKTTTIDAATDMGDFKVVTSGLEGEPVALYGAGKPALLATFDLPFMLSLALPGEEDPAGTALAMMEAVAGMEVPGDFRDDVAALLSGGRISIGVFMDDGDVMPKTAYAQLELSDASVIDKYFGLAGLFMSGASVDGWDAVMTADVYDDIKATLARKGSRVLIGMGEPEAYGVKASRPAEMSPLPDKGVLLSTYVSFQSVLSDTALGRLIKSFIEMGGDEGKQMGEMIEMLDAMSISSIASVQSAPDRSRTIITWR